MTSEEKMQRNMEFIVEQQAQFVVDIQKLQESQVKFQDAHAAADKRMTRIEAALVRGYQETTARINALIGLQEGMVQAQQRTDERLNVFINVVEGLISSGQNGKSIPARKTASKKASKKRGSKK